MNMNMIDVDTEAQDYKQAPKTRMTNNKISIWHWEAVISPAGGCVTVANAQEKRKAGKGLQKE